MIMEDCSVRVLSELIRWWYNTLAASSLDIIQLMWEICATILVVSFEVISFMGWRKMISWFRVIAVPFLCNNSDWLLSGFHSWIYPPPFCQLMFALVHHVCLGQVLFHLTDFCILFYGLYVRWNHRYLRVCISLIIISCMTHAFLAAWSPKCFFFLIYKLIFLGY